MLEERGLDAAGLKCERGGRVLFENLDVRIQAGNLIHLTGENGSGKTSLLRLLCGLLEPAAGEVRWNGAPIGSLREEYSRQIVYLGHAPAVKGDLTAAENLAIGCALAGLPASPAQVDHALAAFGLTDGAVPVRRLSQGQRRRAALARLFLATQVPLWFLDEPFAALDMPAAQRLEVHIAAHVARGAAVIYTTHQEVSLTGGRVLSLS